MNAATKRFRHVSRDDFSSFLGQLKSMVTNFETMLNGNWGNGRTIDGATKGERAVELLEEYATVVNNALTDETF